jgi:hypothetical protein
MHDTRANPDRSTAAGENAEAPGGRRRRSKSMHDGVAVWHDCCSCEAEPYWLESIDGDSDESRTAAKAVRRR